MSVRAMSALAGRLGAASAAPRVLTLDLERLPGRFTRDIWEGRDLARVNYLHPDRWTELPSTLCASWKWHGDKRVGFVAAWEDDDPHHVARVMWQQIEAADVVVTFNGRRADLKWLRQDWAMAGLGLPTPWRDVDLFVVARREFAFESKSLAHLCARLGLPGKHGHYNADEARAAMAADGPERRRLVRYNRQDSRITEAVFDRLRPYVRGINFGLFREDEARCCPSCGSENIVPAGFATTAVTRYPAYRCEDCQTVSRGKHRAASVPLRQVAR
jgi:hypothetical protein